MSKLIDIIDRRFDERLEKMGGLMKYVPAVVTDVQEDYLRADVKLIANNAEIKGMLNKTAEKLTVGQTVTVGYQTMPSSGVILLANGEADPIREGGGVAVENAVLFDEDDLHEYTVDTELMVDISTNTKLYYGATNRMAVVQGMLCFRGQPTTSTFTSLLDDLLTANVDYIASEYTGIISYYYSGSTVYRYEIDVKVFPLEIAIATDGKASYTWRIVQKVKTTNLSTSEVTVNTYTNDRNNCTVSSISDITDYGLLLVAPTFGASSPNQVLDPYIPYGYVGRNTKLDVSSVSGDYHLYTILVFKNSNQGVNKWNANYNGQVGVTTWLYAPRAGAITPLTNAETIFALGATQRSEPVTPNNGGGA